MVVLGDDGERRPGHPHVGDHRPDPVIDHRQGLVGVRERGDVDAQQPLDQVHGAERATRVTWRRSPFGALRRAPRGNVQNMTKSTAQKDESPSQLIDARIEELGDWRGKTLARLRALIKQADPEVVEEWKWRKASNRGFRCGRTTA